MLLSPNVRPRMSNIFGEVWKSHVCGEELTTSSCWYELLCSLGDVFSALSAKKDYIPYDHSMLTYLLADSFGTLTFLGMSHYETCLLLWWSIHIVGDGSWKFYIITCSNLCRKWLQIYWLQSPLWYLFNSVFQELVVFSSQLNTVTFFTGGDSKAVLLVNVSPSLEDVQATIATLDFASRARNAEISLGNQDTIKKWRDLVNYPL